MDSNGRPCIMDVSCCLAASTSGANLGGDSGPLGVAPGGGTGPAVGGEGVEAASSFIVTSVGLGLGEERASCLTYKSEKKV